MDNRSMLFALHHMEGVGWKTISLLVRQLERLHDIARLDEEALAMRSGLPRSKARAVREQLARMGAGEVERLEQSYANDGIGWVTVWDKAYPQWLKHTAQPPWILYYRGNWQLAQKPCLAMVGTRTPTAYGKLTAERLAREVAEAGLCVVSGLARGIDSAAHTGALSGPGGTIAVLGCSIDVVYPPENKPLYRQISERGLLLSEYPRRTKAHPGLFPQRNRIIAGLSLGVVVVEAAEKSGSLITADLALENSRDVFAVPGPISSPKSRGALRLIQQGAKLVAGAEDILEEYARWISMDGMAHIKHTADEPGLTRDQQTVVELLEHGPMSVDELLARTQFTFGHLHSVLIHLLMIKRIVELPGSVYSVP
ncbi:DNA-processing protein DprA [Paenibacillus ginsengihumi]|uniref:DNA-processing protein DprA n=1 Tax=Paenibacillus ginsengihumi TaxID=431596 RepID=UPI00036C0533|nr:DNA-processing protein DprA [Paenibacillus ginsengihumi]